jgi:hypothetical protein
MDLLAGEEERRCVAVLREAEGGNAVLLQLHWNSLAALAVAGVAIDVANVEGAAIDMANVEGAVIGSRTAMKVLRAHTGSVAVVAGRQAEFEVGGAEHCPRTAAEL